jgi:hypothetical protein
MHMCHSKTFQQYQDHGKIDYGLEISMWQTKQTNNLPS